MTRSSSGRLSRHEFITCPITAVRVKNYRVSLLRYRRPVTAVYGSLLPEIPDGFEAVIDARRTPRPTTDVST